jgi:tetratricopeptide (TPR) repeat protein
LGRHADAVLDANKAIELAPNSSAAYAVRGGAYYGQGELHKALEDLDVAISLSAHHDPSALRMRGNVYAALGEQSSAKEDYSEARTIEMQIAPNP